jgi:prepilin-type N-terminal cleavage/methylation domain-containing protein
MKSKKNKSLCHFTPSPLPRKGGFTLIELAIVLVVLGILVGLGVGLVGILTKQAKLRESRETVNQAKEAFLGYAVKNGYLPVEDPYDTNNPVTAFQTVGAKGIDSWTKPLRYIAADELEGSGKEVCGINTTTLTITDKGTPRSNIAFLIISGGENYNIQTNNTIYEIDTPNIDDFPTDINRPENYDDIVAYASLDEIRSLRGCPQPLAITSPTTLPQGEEDSFYSYSLEAIGGMPPYTWSGNITGGTNCDATPGLTLDSSGLISGTISCKDSAPNSGELTACSANINVSAQVTDKAGSNPVSYTGTIPVRPKPLTIITQTLPSAYEGSPYSATISASGGKTPYTWSMSVSPSCPSGLTCPPSGNSISGIPAPGTAGTYTVTSTVNDTCTTNTRNFVLTINPSGGGGGGCTPLSLSPPDGTSWSATVGTYFSQAITVSGGQPPYTNTQCGPLTGNCGGLNLTCTNSDATVSGTPATAGTCSFTVSWQDSCTNPGPQPISGTYTVNINAPACAPFTGWSSNLPVADNCQSYSGSITVIGGESPYSWSLSSGSLPSGINFCTGNTSATCTLSGTQVLTAPGTYNFTVQVIDSCTNPGPQTTPSPFSIAVNDTCYSTGISLANNSNSDIWYSGNGVGCQRRRNNGQAFSVTPGNVYTIYTDNQCRNLCATTDYCGQKNIDLDKDCQTQILGNCQFSDR